MQNQEIKNKYRIAYLQHVEFENLAYIKDWGEEIGVEFLPIKLYKGDSFLDINSFDKLIILGGPMGVYDDVKYPWLKTEKQFIKKTLKSQKPILGICLGAQLIADALGAKVVKNKFTEIGWYSVENIGADFLKDKSYNTFHWHGDTFELPKGAKVIFSNENCINQGFSYCGGKVIALQCHFEVTVKSIKNLILNCREELINTEKIQEEEKILQAVCHVKKLNKTMQDILNYWNGK